MSSHLHEDQFLEEVFGLFALEAQEWISQCKTSLLELEGRPSAERKSKLYESIICSVTNLGGSAATVELPALEKLAFALVPLLQTMRERGDRSAEQLSALREGLEGITFAVEHIDETKNGVVSGLERILQRLKDALTAPSEPVSAAAPVPTSFSTSCPASPLPSMPEQSKAAPDTLFNTLRRLEQAPPASNGHSRHVLQAVIQRAALYDQPQDGSHFDAAALRRILEDLETRDEQLLAALRERLPVIAKCLFRLDLTASQASSNPMVSTLLHEIKSLQEVSAKGEAHAIMRFFRGLEAFLTLLARDGVSVMPERVAAIAARLQTILPMAQQWVEIGKQERGTIQKVVPA